jgi:hypothetical protein
MSSKRPLHPGRSSALCSTQLQNPLPHSWPQGVLLNRGRQIATSKWTRTLAPTLNLCPVSLCYVTEHAAFLPETSSPQN